MLEGRSFIRRMFIIAGIAGIMLFAGCDAPARDSNPDIKPRTSYQDSSDRGTMRYTPPFQPFIQGNPGSPAAIATIPAVVVSVIDGDTLNVRLRTGAQQKVRLIGVNTPESTKRVEPFGQEATRYTRKVLHGRAVFLEMDVQERDRYGRLLAYVWLSEPAVGDETEVREKMFNARLLLEGYAQVMTVPPNVKYVELFRRFQSEAREAGRGLWGYAVSPPIPHFGESAARMDACDPAYPDICIPPPPPDLDCRDISHRRFRVLPPDPHRFDNDHDGVGCER